MTLPYVCCIIKFLLFVPNEMTLHHFVAYVSCVYGKFYSPEKVVMAISRQFMNSIGFSRLLFCVRKKHAKSYFIKLNPYLFAKF